MYLVAGRKSISNKWRRHLPPYVNQATFFRLRTTLGKLLNYDMANKKNSSSGSYLMPSYNSILYEDVPLPKNLSLRPHFPVNFELLRARVDDTTPSCTPFRYYQESCSSRRSHLEEVCVHSVQLHRSLFAASQIYRLARKIILTLERPLFFDFRADLPKSLSFIPDLCCLLWHRSRMQENHVIY